MFIVVPLRTDAAVEHRPWGTVGLIGANVLVAVVLGFADHAGGQEAIDGWVVRFGTLNPLTWITSAFTHFGVVHILFNMIFLWTFGLVVEGLIGWRRFLLLFLAIVAAEGALVQMVMLGAESGGFAGASGGVFGLLAIAALWAPRNNLTVFLWIVILIRTIEVSVMGFCGAWIGLEVVFVLLGGLSMSSAMLHVIGAGLGVACGIWMLKNDQVNCEGWDYLSLRAHGRPRRDIVGAPVPQHGSVPRDPKVEALVRVRDALGANDALGADEVYENARRTVGFVLPRPDFEALTRALCGGGRVERAVRRLEEFLEIHPESADGRLALAEQLVLSRRPTTALEQLDRLGRMPPGSLSEDQRALLADLERRAREARPEKRSGLELE